LAFATGGYGLALAALALVIFGAYHSYPICSQGEQPKYDIDHNAAIFNSIKNIYSFSKTATHFQRINASLYWGG